MELPLFARYRFLMVLLAATGGLIAAPDETVSEAIQGHVVKPKGIPATEMRLRELQMPPGFAIEAYAEGLDGPRMLALGENGDLYVTRRGEDGEVLLLRDANEDGLADDPITAIKLPHVHGIAIRDGKVYLAAIRELYVADIKPDGTFGEARVLYSDLPDAGQHPNRTLAFSPDGQLFLSVGSTANAAAEANPEAATMLRVATDGSGREIFAKGLRNTIGFDWHPQTRELWGMDHGIDWLGDEVQREELNHIKEGGNYGWPFVFEEGKPNPADSPLETTGMTWEDYAATCEGMVLGYDAHAAPMALVFYTGDQFPEKYRGDAFVTFRGSWNRKDPSGYEIARVKFADGRPTTFENFITGFLIEQDGEPAQFGRPCALIQAVDGSLFMSDDSGGVIYRISYADPSEPTASR